MPRRRRRRNEPGCASLLGGLALAVAVSQAKQKRRAQYSNTAQAFHRNVLNANELVPEPLPFGSFSPSSLWSQQLEELAALVFTRLGYRNVKHTGAHSSTDGGVDVWMLSPEGHVEIVQCKQFQSKVDRSELVEFAKIMRQQHAVRGHFWAPSGFTKPAVEYALEAGDIDTYVNYDIAGLVKKVYVPEIDDQLHGTQKVMQVLSPRKPTRSTGLAIWQSCIIAVLGIVLGVILCFGMAYLIASLS